MYFVLGGRYVHVATERLCRLFSIFFVVGLKREVVNVVFFVLSSSHGWLVLRGFVRFCVFEEASHVRQRNELVEERRYVGLQFVKRIVDAVYRAAVTIHKRVPCRLESCQQRITGVR